jgi:hypothetical protein
MDKKNLMYIVGGVAVVGIAYYLYSKKQASKIAPITAPVTTENKSADESLMADPTITTDPLQGKPASPSSTMPVSTTTSPTAPTTTPLTTPSGTIKLSKFEVEKRMLKLCGVRPALKGTRRRNMYNACLTREKDKLRSQGYISFNHTYSNMTSDFDVSFR